MASYPIYKLAPGVPARLQAVALRWIGFSVWCSDRMDEDYESIDLSKDPWMLPEGDGVYEAALPLHLAAGFDLGARLAADVLGLSDRQIRDYVTTVGPRDPSSLFPAEAHTRYLLLPPGPGRLWAILLDLRIKDAV